jgi:glycerol-3-phosphate dehydrogenase (NAD(P)+)
MAFDRIGILGAGSWGTALAQAAARAGRSVTLWGRDRAAVERMAKERNNPKLPQARLDPSIAVTASLADAARADAILLVVPAQSSREVATAIMAHLPAGIPMIACAKGIERGTRKFMTEVIAECIPNAVPAILSGPGFAEDVARGLPTAVTLAASKEKTASDLAQALGSATFRPYHSTDIRGVEIGGAAKNVLAIAAGIVSGRGLGESAAAALTTRGFAELIRFGRACGAQPETLMGLSGLGDLILTCSSPQSRNFAFGIEIGKGRAPDTIETTTGLAEGFHTASVLVEMANERRVDMPIASAVAAVLAGRVSVDDAIEALLTRPFKAEH